MKTSTLCSCWTLAVAAATCLCGCDTETTSDSPTPVAEMPPNIHTDEHGHDHTAPHGGHLIELGHSHEYHAELVEDDEAETVTVHILDKFLAPLPIEAESVALNLSAKGQPQSFTLAAVDATEGKASTFVSEDVSLFATLEESHEVKGKLRVNIAGVSYSGAIEHHHHHDGDDGHDHDHDPAGHHGEDSDHPH